MMGESDSGSDTSIRAERIVPLDRGRTFITLLVVCTENPIWVDDVVESPKLAE